MNNHQIRTRARSKVEPVIAIVTTFHGEDEVANREVDLSMPEDRNWLLSAAKWAVHNGRVVEIASPETLDAEK